MKDNITNFSVNEDGLTYIKNGEYTSWSKRSLEKVKKNIKKVDYECLELIKGGDIYEFNYKEENDDYKKHIGFVIGNKYKTPSKILNDKKDGIDYDSATSILWKAVQEQQVQIEKLQKELEEKINGKN